MIVRELISFLNQFRKGGYSETVLEDCVEENYRIVKREYNDRYGEAQYCLIRDGDLMSTYMRGYHQEDGSFYLKRIRNIDRKAGTRYLVKVFRAMEQDLRAKGTKRISAVALCRLVNLATRRYGFCAADDWDHGIMGESWFRYVPWKAVPLEKRLTD